MSKKLSKGAKEIVDEANPVKFLQRLRKMPLVDRIFSIIDRFLM